MEEGDKDLKNYISLHFPCVMTKINFYFFIKKFGVCVCVSDIDVSRNGNNLKLKVKTISITIPIIV